MESGIRTVVCGPCASRYPQDRCVVPAPIPAAASNNESVGIIQQCHQATAGICYSTSVSVLRIRLQPVQHAHNWMYMCTRLGTVVECSSLCQQALYGIDVINVFSVFIPATFLTFFMGFIYKKSSLKIPPRSSTGTFKTKETN